jgi:predicted nucleic acid-binding protein
MKWVADTCIVIDVLENDPDFGPASARLLDRMAPEGLVLCPISYVELAPAFLGDSRRQNEFLDGIGIQYAFPWEWQDTQHAHKAWDRHVNLYRKRQALRRPVADMLIGAFAMGRRGLLTRNAVDFRPAFPMLKIIEPTE